VVISGTSYIRLTEPVCQMQSHDESLGSLLYSVY
jgi:hypothetical protein